MEVFIDGDVTNIADSLIVSRNSQYEEKKNNSVPYYDLSGKPHDAFLESFQYINILGYNIYRLPNSRSNNIHVMFTDRGIFSCDHAFYSRKEGVKPIIAQAIGSISDNEYIKPFHGMFTDTANKCNRNIQVCATNRNNIYWIRLVFKRVSEMLYYDESDTEFPYMLECNLAETIDDSFIMKIPDNCQLYDALPSEHAYLLLHGLYNGTLNIIVIIPPDAMDAENKAIDDDVKDYINAHCIYKKPITEVSDYAIVTSDNTLVIAYTKSGASHNIKFNINNGVPDLSDVDTSPGEVIAVSAVKGNTIKSYNFTTNGYMCIDQDKIMTVQNGKEVETAKIIYKDDRGVITHNLIPMDVNASGIFPIEADGQNIKSSAIADDLCIYSVQGEQEGAINGTSLNVNLFGWVHTHGCAFYMHTNKGTFYVCTPPAYFTSVNVENMLYPICPAYKLTDSYLTAPDKKALVFTLNHFNDIPIDYSTCDILKYVTSSSAVNDSKMVSYNGDSVKSITHISKFSGSTNVSNLKDDHAQYTSTTNHFSITMDTVNGTGIIGSTNGDKKLEFTLVCELNTTVSGVIKTTMGGYRYSAFGIYLTDAPFFEDEAIVYASGNIISPNIHTLTTTVQQMYDTINKLNERLKALEYNCGRIKRV